MATSISKAQAEALAVGFLNTFGTDRTGLRVEKTLSELIILAGGLVIDAQNNLNKADRVATGALSASMKVLNPESVAGKIQVDVEMLEYYKFIDAGVKGTKSGHSSKGYSYKDKYPPVNELRKWIIREGLKAKTPVGGKPITKREKRRSGITETSNKVAFLIARSIFWHGLKRTNFFVKALTKTKAKSKEVFAKAFKIDIINAIPKTLKSL